MKKTIIYTILAVGVAGLFIPGIIYFGRGTPYTLTVMHKSMPGASGSLRIQPLTITNLRALNNEEHIFSATGFRTMRIKTSSITRLKKLGVFLYEGQGTNQARKISGNVINSSNGSLTILCPQCEQETSNPDNSGNYLLSIKNDASPPFKITFSGLNGRQVVLEVIPQTPDDHATIDIAFDDSSPFTFF